MAVSWRVLSWKMSAVAGWTVMLESAGSDTVAVACPVTGLTVAETVVVPTALPVRAPVADTVATATVEETHVACAVTSAVLPSE